MPEKINGLMVSANSSRCDRLKNKLKSCPVELMQKKKHFATTGF